ncbi:uncharacterized protein LOC100892674 [Strongylocentrotus purpuratus]|uniref:Peptidase aspartic putative domain-containing protein n=1 Tax=Strongylocentrotus purpuratus TaxID=7668 RepID=A0A7M7PQE8_STRPU|nr:uncharacterized protein LOC100892674 [Strongylocentrotus purpuratus]
MAMATSLPEKLEQGSVKSKRSVQSERVLQAFHDELQMMDQEDELKRIEFARKQEEARIEFARKQEEANSKLRKLKLTKQFNERMAELEGSRDDIEYSETHSVKLDLPEEKREDSIQRYLQSQDSVAQQSPQQPRSYVTPVYESNGLQKVAESLAEVARSMAIQSASSRQVAVTSQLPPIDLPVFSGDPLQYPLWKNAFVSLVDRNPVDHPTKLHYLNNSVAGAPKRLVQHYLLLGTEDAYHKACGALAERYGSQSVVSTAFTKKLNSWPRISNQDSTGLRDFADFLNQVEAAKVTISTLDILDFPQENVKMLEKLPAYLARKWRDEVDRWQRCGLGSYPTFARFAEFVNDAARKASIPELECLKNQESRPRQFPAGNKGFAGKSLSTRAFNGGQQGKFSSCPFCNEKHHLDECQEFAKKPHPLRKAFFFQKKLCMGCGSDDSHQAKDCPQRKTCEDCQGRHLTCLHRPQNREYEGSSKCTNVCSLPDQDGKEHCMIVPVWVRHASNPGNEILQYAILDDQSNVGFVSKALCEKMRVDGTDTNLQLTTMHESTRIKTSRICGLEVLDFKKEHVVTLPACYQRDDVPARRSQIPKGDVMRRWAHLSPIVNDLMPYNPAIEVGLLIGNDCPRAIRPRDIICGGEDEPYAQRSILGWGVVGTVCMSANQEIFCKKTCVKDDYPRFAYANRAREVFSQERVLNVQEKDIIEMNQKGKPYSIDEMKFMSMLEKGVRKTEDGHYEMPLPLKSKEMSRPYNKPLAIKRWNQLTARLRKNHKFQEDYTEFMKGVIADHAERVPPDRLNATVSVRMSERSRY